jgi:hypothetical protein
MATLFEHHRPIIVGIEVVAGLVQMSPCAAMIVLGALRPR